MEKIAAYFRRIGLDMPEKIVPDGELLKKLQFAHCTTVPYENLDIIRGIPLSLDPDDLYDKVVTRGKGGFCFELNGIFGWLLRRLGYEVTDVAARYLRRLEEGLEQPQFDECYRFDRDPFLGWVLMDKHHGEWRQFYSFTEEPQLIVDFIAPTFYCEKHPDSPFFPNEMFSMKTAEGRFTLDGHLYKEFRNGEVFAKELSEAELPEAYRRFGLEWAEG